MPVTNEEIMEELKKVEAKLDTIQSEEDKIEKEEEETLQAEKKIEAEESKELEEIEDSNINLEFENMEDWRQYIWADCEYKEEKTEGDEVDFFCKKKNGPCRFDGCPLNYKDKKSD